MPTKKAIVQQTSDSKQNLTNNNANLSMNFIRYADKVSAIPEMSDISESSSNDCEKKNKQKRAKRQRINETNEVYLFKKFFIFNLIFRFIYR